MSAINLVEVYKIVNSFFNYFEGNFLIVKISSFEKTRIFPTEINF